LSTRVAGMYLAYLDDSGDPGVHAGSPTPTYTTSCVFVRDAHWVALFEDLIRFSRYLRQNFGLRMRQEVKANELVKGSGPWASLPYGDKFRKRIFRSFMRLQGKVGTSPDIRGYPRQVALRVGGRARHRGASYARTGRGIRSTQQ
jgi:hypothetical protein